MNCVTSFESEQMLKIERGGSKTVVVDETEALEAGNGSVGPERRRRCSSGVLRSLLLFYTYPGIVVKVLRFLWHEQYMHCMYYAFFTPLYHCVYVHLLHHF
jgi:hypothetical protein